VCAVVGGWALSGVRFGTVAKAATAVFGGATLARRIPMLLRPKDGRPRSTTSFAHTVYKV
jgi:hypothetical protein